MSSRLERAGDNLIKLGKPDEDTARSLAKKFYELQRQLEKAGINDEEIFDLHNSFGDLVLNRSKRIITKLERDLEKDLDLSPGEFSFMEKLISRGGALIPYSDFGSSRNAVKTMVSRLRDKLSEYDSGVKIRTLRSSGIALDYSSLDQQA